MSDPPPIEPAPTSSAAFAGRGPLTAGVDAFRANGGGEAVVVPAGEEAQPASEWLAALEDERVALLHVARDRGGDWPTAAVLSDVAGWCRARGVLLVADVPAGTSAEEAIAFAARLRESAHEAAGHVAVYFPALREGSTGGAVAGVIARTAVWKTPAGTGATIGEGLSPAAELSDGVVRELAEAGVNTLRVLPNGVTVVWGGRTLSADPEWKYVAVRRLNIFIEHSIDGWLRWAVFEPNDEPLWATIRRDAENFLTLLWRQGALQGTKPEQAFFVRCGLGSTMTAADVADGRLLVTIGFAPLRPAEFVLIELQRTVLAPPP